MMADWVLALLTIAPAVKPDKVFEMDALYSIIICSAHLRRNARTGTGSSTREEDGVWRDIGGGRKSMKITSADALRAAMKTGLRL
jgi:hypothetical protein